MSELVSVFLPTHARFKNGLLEKAVESVLGQTYRNFELLVVDDASVDGTFDYISEIVKQNENVKHIRFDKNIGLPARTLAESYLQAKGDLFAFAFDDTEWLPNHLEMLVGCLHNNPMAGMAYGGVKVHLPEVKSQILGQEEFDLAKLTEYNYIGNCGVILKRSTIDQVGWYDPHILVKKCCDWDLWLRIGKKKIPVVCCPEIIAHENGALQKDSLGSSVSFYDALSRKYMATERDYLLAPKLIASDKSPMFDTAEWMTKEETKQLRILAFEHYLRTFETAEAIQLSKKWLAENNKTALEKEEIELLIMAFNLYLTETQYSCKGACESTYKLTEAITNMDHHYSQLKTNYDDIVDKYSQTNNEYHEMMRSLSWRITKPIRQFKKIYHSNKYFYQATKALTKSFGRSKVG